MVTGVVVLVLDVALALVVRAKNPENGLPWGIVLAFAGLPIFWLLSAFVSLRKLRGMSFQTVIDPSHILAISEMSSSGLVSKTMVSKEKAFPELVSLPRPRKLKMTLRGRCDFFFALAVVSLFTVYGLPVLWTESNNPHASQQEKWLLLAPVVLIYGNAFNFFRNRFRERSLLANGEVASGYITAQYNGRYSQSVRYCFKLAGGRLVTGNCTDASRSLYEGMTVPVFYDAENPTRSIPLNCSLTKIA